MMIPGILAQRRLGAQPLAQLIGTVATSDTFTGANFTLSVPAGAAVGDTLVAILRCRADRSFTVPSGWTADTNDVVVGISGTTTVNTKLYIIYKVYAGETSLTFTQSVAAAGLAVLVVVRGLIGAVVKQNNASSNVVSPVNSRSLVLAIGTSSGMPNISATWAAPFPQGTSYKWSATANYFYGVSVSGYSSGSTESVDASYNWPADTNPGVNYIWVAEILPPA